MEEGFGIETDIRDFRRQVVVSHDPTLSEPVLTLRELTMETQKFDTVVALNVKSDGLLNLALREQITGREFFFDMSVPEQIQYERAGLTVATRISELEKSDSLAQGPIWLDCFNSDCILKIPNGTA